MSTTYGRPILERANIRWRRRRQAWRNATIGKVASIAEAFRHPSWRLVEEANALLLRLP